MSLYLVTTRYLYNITDDVVDVFMKQLLLSSLPTHRGCHVSPGPERRTVCISPYTRYANASRVYAPRRCQKTLRRVPPLSINTGGRGPTALRAARSQSSTQNEPHAVRGAGGHGALVASLTACDLHAVQWPQRQTRDSKFIPSAARVVSLCAT